MNNVQFEDNSSDLAKRRNVVPSQKKSFIYKIFYSVGLKKDSQVHLAMIITSVIAIILAVILLIRDQQPPDYGIKLYKEDFTKEEIEQLPPGTYDLLPSRYEQ